MKVNPRNLVKHELIGLLVKVSGSTHKEFVGISGVIVDETARTVKVLSKDGKIRAVPKDVCTFDITLPIGTIIRVNGKVILGRPEERIRKKLKYW